MKCLVFISGLELLNKFADVPVLSTTIEGLLDNVPITILVDEPYFLDYYFWKWFFYSSKGLTVLSNTILSSYTYKLIYWINKLEISENLLVIDTRCLIEAKLVNNFICKFKETDELLFSRNLGLVLYPRKSILDILEYSSVHSTGVDKLIDYLSTRFSYRIYLNE